MGPERSICIEVLRSRQRVVVPSRSVVILFQGPLDIGPKCFVWYEPFTVLRVYRRKPLVRVKVFTDAHLSRPISPTIPLKIARVLCFKSERSTHTPLYMPCAFQLHFPIFVCQSLLYSALYSVFADLLASVFPIPFFFII